MKGSINMTELEARFYEIMIMTMQEIVKQNDELIELLKNEKGNDNE